MKWMIRKWAGRRAAAVRQGAKRVAVMVPLPSARLSADERVSMKHLRAFLGGYDKFLLVPRGSGVRMDGFSVIELDRRHFGSAANHNRMLYRTDFWENFADYEYVLMYHLDALVFSDRLEEWCDEGVDFIGAPFLSCADSPWVKTERVGNGGFALYRVPSVLKVLWNRYIQQPSRYYEDHFWPLFAVPRRVLRPLRAAVPGWLRGRFTAPLRSQVQKLDHIEANDLGNDGFWADEAVNYLPEFKVASLEQGLRFAFEVSPRSCLERCGGRMPFGCHAWGRYDREFWQPYLIEQLARPGQAGDVKGQFIKCPGLKELPAPPPGRHGWPWDTATPALPLRTRGDKPWPKISIITPSFNQGCYLEETLRSVLLQGYPNLEYHVVDGGSSDQSVEILRKYEPWLSSWVSEEDGGQSDAINKGFAKCDGEICNWLCSDDVLAPGALHGVAARFCAMPQTGVVAGACLLQYDDDPQRNSIRQVEWTHWQAAPYSGVIWQPSCFFRRELVGRAYLVRTDLHYCMDRELWAYLWSKGCVWERTEQMLSVFRFTGANKSTTGGQKVIRELDEIHRSYFKEVVPLPYVLRRCWLPLVLAGHRHPAPWVRVLCRGASRAVTLGLLTLYCRRRVRALQTDFFHHGGCFEAAHMRS